MNLPTAFGVSHGVNETRINITPVFITWCKNTGIDYKAFVKAFNYLRFLTLVTETIDTNLYYFGIDASLENIFLFVRKELTNPQANVEANKVVTLIMPKFYDIFLMEQAREILFPCPMSKRINI
jgi:hypothetical protein